MAKLVSSIAVLALFLGNQTKPPALDLAQKSPAYRAFLILRNHDPLIGPAEISVAHNIAVVRFSNDTRGPLGRAGANHAALPQQWLLFTHLDDGSVSELEMETDDGKNQVAVFPDGSVLLAAKDELIQIDGSAHITRRLPVHDICDVPTLQDGFITTDVYPATDDTALAVRTVFALRQNAAGLKGYIQQEAHYCWFDKSRFTRIAETVAKQADHHWLTVRGLTAAGFYDKFFQIKPNGPTALDVPCDFGRAYLLRTNSATGSICDQRHLRVVSPNAKPIDIRIPAYPLQFQQAWSRPVIAMLFWRRGNWRGAPSVDINSSRSPSSYEIQVWDYQAGRRLFNLSRSFEVSSVNGYSGESIGMAVDPEGTKLVVLMNGELSIYPIE